MIFSKATDYSILIIGYLSSLTSDVLESKVQISENLDLPRAFVSKLLQQLHNAGLIHSVRGRNGGYKLTKSPENITLKDVMEAIDGKLHMVECLSEHSEGCRRARLCNPVVKELMFIEEKINKNLDSLNFSQMKITV
jgi:Rrf2 family protein